MKRLHFIILDVRCVDKNQQELQIDFVGLCKSSIKQYVNYKAYLTNTESSDGVSLLYFSTSTCKVICKPTKFSHVKELHNFIDTIQLDVQHHETTPPGESKGLECIEMVSQFVAGVRQRAGGRDVHVKCSLISTTPDFFPAAMPGRITAVMTSLYEQSVDAEFILVSLPLETDGASSFAKLSQFALLMRDWLNCTIARIPYGTAALEKMVKGWLRASMPERHLRLRLSPDLELSCAASNETATEPLLRLVNVCPCHREPCNAFQSNFCPPRFDLHGVPDGWKVQNWVAFHIMEKLFHEKFSVIPGDASGARHEGGDDATIILSAEKRVPQDSVNSRFLCDKVYLISALEGDAESERTDSNQKYFAALCAALCQRCLVTRSERAMADAAKSLLPRYYLLVPDEAGAPVLFLRQMGASGEKRTVILTVTQEIVANEAFFPVLDTNPQTIDEAARARIEAVLQTIGSGELSPLTLRNGYHERVSEILHANLSSCILGHSQPSFRTTATYARASVSRITTTQVSKK